MPDDFSDFDEDDIDDDEWEDEIDDDCAEDDIDEFGDDEEH